MRLLLLKPLEFITSEKNFLLHFLHLEFFRFSQMVLANHGAVFDYRVIVSAK